MSVQQHLEELHDWFSRSISSAYRQAWSVEEPAGVAPEWREICTSFEVTPISDEEREQVRCAQRPHRGAAVMEVAQVISAIVDQAKVSLGHVDPTGVSPELASVHDKLRRLIERTEREVVEAYKRAVLPKRVGMFANALAHHDASAAPAGAPSAHALLCMTCGAPRLSDADFSCPFCNQHMAKPEHP